MKLNVTIPARNEAELLERSVRRLHAFLTGHMSGWDWEIVVADNGSTDGTTAIALRLASEMSRVRCLQLEAPGRGRALRRAWHATDRDVCSYMDADLSSDLDAFPRLVDLVWREGCGVAYGSRLGAGAVTTRGLSRSVLSHGYNVLLRAALRTSVLDAQCGFKAASRRVVDEVVPLVANDEWFFDTELLILAEHLGFRTAALPVAWTERLPSHVRVARTIGEDLAGIWRLRRALRRQVRVAVGAGSR